MGTKSSGGRRVAWREKFRTRRARARCASGGGAADVAAVTAAVVNVVVVVAAAVVIVVVVAVVVVVVLVLVVVGRGGCSRVAVFGRWPDKKNPREAGLSA